MKIFVLSILIIAAYSCNAQGKLILPVRDGRFRDTSLMAVNTERKDLIIYPTTSYQVRAAEKGIVKTVAYADTIFLIIVQGHYEIAYMNLHKVFVKYGDTVKAGQVIAELQIAKDAPDLEALMLQIKKNGKYIFSQSIFAR